MRARSYDKRMIAAGVADVRLADVTPERADFEADVFDQRWEHPNGAGVTFAVLGLNHAHAERLGRIRLAERHGVVEAATLLLRENVTLGDYDAHRMANVLNNETLAERDDRRTAWKRGEFPTRKTPAPVVQETEADAWDARRDGLKRVAGWR